VPPGLEVSAARVVLTLSPGPGDRVRHTATCTGCGWTYSNSVKTDVAQQKRWHTHSCQEVKP
jgi:hypothetical protein